MLNYAYKKKNVYFELTFFIWCTGSEIREVGVTTINIIDIVIIVK